VPIVALPHPAEIWYFPAEVIDSFNRSLGVGLARRNKMRLPIPVNDRFSDSVKFI